MEKSFAYTALLPLFLYFSLVVIPCDSQFISHINARGLKGNITFDVKQDFNGSSLVIGAIIESDKPIESLEQNDEEFDKSQEILFDWSIKSNTLSPQMLYTCSNDELGSSASENIIKSISGKRAIVLDKTNVWILPLENFIQQNPTAQSVSDLIWSKSIQLKLSSHHHEQVQNLPDVKASNNETATSGVVKPMRASVLINVTKPPPRSKPSILPKLKTPSLVSALPKPEALVAEQSNLPQENNDTSLAKIPTAIATTTTTTTTTTPTPVVSSSSPLAPLAPSQPSKASKKEILMKTHKRIVQAYGRTVVCGNIIDTRNVKTAEAVFESQIAGKVTLRGNEDDTTLISLDLYHIKSKVTTRHDWKLLASDILDNRPSEERCKYLEAVFDPNNVDDSGCKLNEATKCRMGDLTRKHGQIQVAGQGKSTRTTIVDLNLPLSALGGSRSLFLVIYQPVSTSSKQKPGIASCAQINLVNTRKIEANFNMDGVRGTIKMSQRHITEPTFISYDLFGLEGNIKHQTIRELPLSIPTSNDNNKLCSALGNIFNPYKTPQMVNSGSTAIDSLPVGNLSAKHGQLSVIDSEYEDHYMGEFIDLSVQLFGPHTVVGRSILLHKNNGDPWVCSNLDYIDESVKLAVATFYYPVVGLISFQQLSEDSHAETGVLVEVYNPNSEKSSDGHNWMIHLKPAMADFYNWSQRCESSGEIFDPLQASAGISSDLYNRQCQLSKLSEPMRCRSGDTSLKSGFKLSLPVSHINRSRYYYTDLFLPITGPNSIVGKSVVIYDEASPVQRGNRLACSTIKMVHPLKAAIKSWNSGPSIPSAVTGFVTFNQESKFKTTKVKIDLNGFNGNVENYAIHDVWTMDDREFPCSNDSLYDIYDPYDNEKSLQLPPSAHYGSLATVDRVRVGDMSRKHGTFEGLQVAQKSYQDANLPLFAPHSIIGRSMILRAAVNDFRWVCGNIELDYDKGESREIVGLASFDEPRSKIAGYVRFVQLEYKDGSLSNTYVQVDLKLRGDGIHDLETSESHNWAVFVNQVGEDAYITADEVRCIAAGFKWNPYLAQDTLETYPTSCTQSEPLACAMGDLGMRHGLLTLGPNNRKVVSDSNLPLVGNYSVMGRSLIIADNKRASVKLACANIFPDIHLKSNVVIKRTPSFTVARFVEQMRSLLGAAEWLMIPELKATKPVANGECVQMTIHFYGQKAYQMQTELNNLITLGTVRKSTRVGNEKISTHYKLCRINQMQLISSASSPHSKLDQFSRYMIIAFTFIVLKMFT